MGQHEVLTVHEFSVLSFQLQILGSSFLMQYQQDLPLGRMHPAKKDLTRSDRLLAVCFSLEIFSSDYQETLFSLKENGTRHGRGTHEKSRLLPYSAILPYHSLAFAMTKHSSKPWRLSDP